MGWNEDWTFGWKIKLSMATSHDGYGLHPWFKTVLFLYTLKITNCCGNIYKYQSGEPHSAQWDIFLNRHAIVSNIIVALFLVLIKSFLQIYYIKLETLKPPFIYCCARSNNIDDYWVSHEALAFLHLIISLPHPHRYLTAIFLVLPMRGQRVISWPRNLHLHLLLQRQNHLLGTSAYKL